jgi:hypothetical protein
MSRHRGGGSWVRVPSSPPVLTRASCSSDRAGFMRDRTSVDHGEDPPDFGYALEPVRASRLVEHNQAGKRRQSGANAGGDRVPPIKLEVGHEARDDHDIQGTRPDDLVRDVDAVRSRLARHGASTSTASAVTRHEVNRRGAVDRLGPAAGHTSSSWRRLRPRRIDGLGRTRRATGPTHGLVSDPGAGVGSRKCIRAGLTGLATIPAASGRRAVRRCPPRPGRWRFPGLTRPRPDVWRRPIV